MIVENGYIQFKVATRDLDDNGNPIIVDEDFGPMLPANVQGNTNYDGFKSEGGDRYSSPTYSVTINEMDVSSVNRCRLYTRYKTYLGEFYIRTRTICELTRTIKLTV